jgi:transcription elongation factor GreA
MNTTTTKTEFRLTAAGMAALKAELQELTTTKRAEIAVRLKLAKEEGDLSENAMYDAAREDQGFTEGRIAEIEHILKHSSLISSTGKSEVALGSTVHVVLAGGTQKYTIVGSTEANPDEGKISEESLVGKALLGKKAGDEVSVLVPSGTLTYTIHKVE